MKDRKKTVEDSGLLSKDMSREKNRNHGKKTNFEDEDDEFEWEESGEWDEDLFKFRR